MATVTARLTFDGNLQVNTPVTGTIFNEISRSTIGVDPSNFYAVEFDEVSMDPTFIASAKAQDATNSLTVVINKPLGTIDGDLMIAYVSGTSSAPTWTPPAGWTGINTNGGAWFGYKIAVSEGASYTFTCNTSATQSGFILTFRNVSYDLAGTYSPAANPSVTPSITVTKDNSIEVVIAITQAGGTGQTYTAPAGFNQLDFDSDSTAPSWAVFSKLVNAGATGTVSITGTNGALANQRSIQLALSPNLVPMRYFPGGSVQIIGVLDETSTLT